MLQTMVLDIRLLGRPHAEVDGRAVPGPRGRKAWALLAVLLLAERPVSRRSAAGLLFPDADDPLGALRWTLSQLRRALGDHLSIEGDPVVVRLAPGCRVDVTDLLGEQLDGAGEPAGLDPLATLLDGADGLAGPDFDLWLTAARHRLEEAQGARLRQAADRALAAARPSAAVAAAAGAVVAEPHQVDARATLVSSLVAAEDHQAALAQLQQWSRWIRQELVIGRLMGEGSATDGDRAPPPADLDTLCRIEAGQAAMAAGAVPSGLEHLRDAVRLAARRDDERLQATALFTLGGSLVHAVAAHATEGTQALQEAARLARRSGDHGLVAEALRDLAYVENTTGRVASTRRLLAAAANEAGDDAHAMSAVRAIEGMFLADRGQHGRALRALRDSARLAESAGRMRQAAWSISIASRSLLLRDELDTAAEYAEQSLQIVLEERWTAMLPWMEAILAELDLAAGRVEAAERRLRHAWSLSLVLGDWCWQGMAARGLGMVAFARGDLPEALRWLEEAVRRAAQDEDRYVWIHGWVQEALCRVSVAARLPRAAADIARLTAIAARSSQPEFAARAELHRAALGPRSSRNRARTLAGAVDNPALV
jgi:DNA-binding SARP family transcriptional activator